MVPVFFGGDRATAWMIGVRARCACVLPADVGAYDDARVSVSRFWIDRNAFLGAKVASSTTNEHNPIGLNVQLDHPDFTSLAQAVRFRNNGWKVDSLVLPLPPADGPGGLGP